MRERRLARHDLVWLDPLAARAACAAGPCAAADREAARRLADWVGASHPLIVTRQAPEVGAARIRLGLALPPALGKLRLAFDVPRGAIARSAPPPALTAATAVALPVAWRARALTLAGLPAIAGAAPRLFGSAAMQLASGLPCLGADSDLDLLLTPHDWAGAQAACRALAAMDEDGAVPRVDGEIRNAAGEAVAWRELASDSRQLLAKGQCEVRLLAREAFAEGFRAAAGAAAGIAA
jgi:phosphoribosyl-dephospho-CoA transferase